MGWTDEEAACAGPGGGGGQSDIYCWPMTKLVYIPKEALLFVQCRIQKGHFKVTNLIEFTSNLHAETSITLLTKCLYCIFCVYTHLFVGHLEEFQRRLLQLICCFLDGLC